MVKVKGQGHQIGKCDFREISLIYTNLSNLEYGVILCDATMSVLRNDCHQCSVVFFCPYFQEIIDIIVTEK